eukprot:jgi/Astpho2/4431/Aster-x1240
MELGAEVDAIGDEIMQFQQERQGRLNELETAVLLHLHQVEFLEDQDLPQDLSSALLVGQGDLTRLQGRVQELSAERAALKQSQHELRKQHLQLLRDKAAQQKQLQELQQRVIDVQMLKFGKIIDLDVLDKIGSVKGAADLKAQLKKQESACAQELAEWDRRIKARRNELAALTQANTRCLTAMATLAGTQRSLEASLAATQASFLYMTLLIGGCGNAQQHMQKCAQLFQDPLAAKRKELREKDALVDEVNKQAQELEALKAQLHSLRSKGPNAQTPRQ